MASLQHRAFSARPPKSRKINLADQDTLFLRALRADLMRNAKEIPLEDPVEEARPVQVAVPA